MHLGWYMARRTVENIGNFSDMKIKYYCPHWDSNLGLLGYYYIL